MSKPKPQTRSAHVLFRPQPINLDWKRLSSEAGRKLPRKVREAVITAIRAYDGNLHLRTDARARSSLRPEIAELQRCLAGALVSWKKLQSSETGQTLLSDLDSEIESAHGNRNGLSLNAAVGAVERVQPFLRVIVDQSFARKWERQLSENHGDAASSVHRVAAPLGPMKKGGSSLPERDFIWGLAEHQRAWRNDGGNDPALLSGVPSLRAVPALDAARQF